MGRKKKIQPVSIEEILSTEKNDKSDYVYQREKLRDIVDIKINHELSERQNAILDTIKDKESKIIFIDGPAGTSKTYLAILAGLQCLNSKRISDILYLRSAVESSNSKMGFLPGDIEQKTDVYLEPLYDKLGEFLNTSDIKKLKDENRIQGKSTAYLRGLSWNVKYILVDEAQNLEFKELLTILTRIGKFSKLVLVGDVQQADIGKKSGFHDMMMIFSTQEAIDKGIRVINLDEKDIVRSDVVQFIVTEINRYHKDKISNT